MTTGCGAGLHVRDLVAGYAPNADVLRGISIEVEPGDAVALLGANGAGKTTLLRTISGLLRPRAGSIHLGDADLAGLPSHAIARAGVAHVPERRQIFVHQTVRDNLLLGAMRSRQADERMQRMLEIFPVLHTKLDCLGGELSGGQQQALAIARGLMSRPRVLLLDEPSLGLSPKLVDVMTDVLRTVRRELDTAVLVVEQNALLPAEATDRAYVMRRGEIVLQQDSNGLIANRELVAAYLR